MSRWNTNVLYIVVSFSLQFMIVMKVSIIIFTIQMGKVYCRL